MRHSFLPFTLISLGFAMLLYALAMPLFEWKISEIVTDFPPNYEIQVFPPWTARFGESINDDSYTYRKVSVLIDRKECYNEDIKLSIRRSQKDEDSEQVWLNIYKSVSWLPRWSLFETVISIMYIWWFVIWYKHQSLWKAIGLTVLAVFILLNLLPRLTSPLDPYTFPGIVDCYEGTITFNASLSKIHYETPIVFFIGILMELGALVIMAQQTIKAAIERKSASNSS
jgi:hypothetical protein